MHNLQGMINNEANGRQIKYQLDAQSEPSCAQPARPVGIVKMCNALCASPHSSQIKGVEVSSVWRLACAGKEKEWKKTRIEATCFSPVESTSVSHSLLGFAGNMMDLEVNWLTSSVGCSQNLSLQSCAIRFACFDSGRSCFQRGCMQESVSGPGQLQRCLRGLIPNFRLTYPRSPCCQRKILLL